MNEPLLIIIAGPTGSGKTHLSIKLALKLKCSILCADSRQVFKELKIGSAAPTEKEMQLVPHYFAGSHSIHDTFNAGTFADEALKCLEGLFSKQPIQIVTGGSGLYIDALLNGFDTMPEVDPSIRKQLITQFEEQGLETLRNQLREKDPEYFSQVDQNNPQRVIRALEIIEQSGKPYSSFRKSKETSHPRPFKYLFFALSLERQVLYKRINARTHDMIENGWIEEARPLHPYRELNALKTLGYTELFDHFEGKYSLEKAIEQIQQNTRRFAKRQLTWLRSKENVIWLEGDEDDFMSQIESHLKQNLAT